MGEKEGYLPFPEKFQTEAIHYAQEVSNWKSKSVVPQIVMSTIFALDDPTTSWKFAYSRVQNPNRLILERVMSRLHKGKFGLCFSSGMSALLALVGIWNKDDHIVCSKELNGEHYEMFNKIASDFCVRTSFVDFSKPENICEAITEKTKLMWLETPSDPTLKITDIKLAAQIAKESKILLAVNNTFSTPYLQRPLELGADVVFESVTKYVNGHSDADMGCLCVQDEALMKRLYILQTVFGTVPSPFDCCQVLRGMRTLNLRMQAHHKNSLSIAYLLEKHPAVEQVIHPGLLSHPQHDLFKKQSCGHGGDIAIYVKGGLAEAQKFVKKLSVFTITEVSGGFESTVQIPFLMSHKNITKNQKSELCITENLIKLSIGLESICDLVADLENALDSLKSEKGGDCKK